MEKIAYKIYALLNKAHGGTTEEEAQALIEKAFELASKYNININELEINNKKKQQQKYYRHVYSYKTELNESYIEQYGKPTVFKSAKGFKEHELAYRDGRLDGNSIELNKAVNGKERAQIE